jgi:Actinobacteria/chloroflexi VLRF1 release factor
MAIRRCDWRGSVVKNRSSGSTRWVDVAPERFPGWIASFARRHGANDQNSPLTVTLTGGNVTITAPDGAVAECHPPFPPFDPPDKDSTAERMAEAIAAHAQQPRTVGVLLVRLGGYAAGVFTGFPPVLADAKTGSRLVHGRSAAGGWSQHRFARRREKQVNEALDAAARAATDVFGRWGRSGETRGRSGEKITARSGDAKAARKPQLDAVVLGGDKRAMAELRQDPRLAPYLTIATDRFLTVPDPKRAVLEDAPRLLLAVRIRLTEPSP